MFNFIAFLGRLQAILKQAFRLHSIPEPIFQVVADKDIDQDNNYNDDDELNLQTLQILILLIKT